MVQRRRRVVWTDEAKRAIDEAARYIARSSPTAAIRLLDQAFDAAARLETLSERGRVVPEINNPRIREIFVQRYRLMYELDDSRVRVIAFLHSARDFSRWQREQAPDL